MPAVLSYPGVYLEEIPSGVRTVMSVATSIAAFVGRAAKGPVEEAVVINSYADFERIFGGLWLGGRLGYAVRDFYLNGGSQAVIVRLLHASTGQAGGTAAPAPGPGTPSPAPGPATPAPGPGTPPSPSPSASPSPSGTPAAAGAAAAPTAKINYENLTLVAASEGAWASTLRVRVDQKDVADTDHDFNLTVRDTATNTGEVFRNLSISPGPRLVSQVLESTSKLVRWEGAVNLTKPPKNHADPTPDKAKLLWSDDSYSTAASGGSDGEPLTPDDFVGTGKDAAKTGLYTLRNADLFNLLCIPEAPQSDSNFMAAALALCAERRAMFLIDPPATWIDKDAAKTKPDFASDPNAKNGAIYFPRIQQPDPLQNGQVLPFAPCGAVAGVIARTDTTRGVWKAPAGLDAALGGVPQLAVALTDAEIGELNPLGVNCLRTAPAAGRVVWGSRTLVGDDRLASEWKYLPVRRTALFIEESLYRATQWIVFEPNDEPLWSQVRLNIGAFMHDLFKKGAFQGTTAKQAYFVKCDKETTTQSDINQGIVNIVVGFAPLKPAEFVVIQIQQMAGDIDV